MDVRSIFDSSLRGLSVFVLVFIAISFLYMFCRQDFLIEIILYTKFICKDIIIGFS